MKTATQAVKVPMEVEYKPAWLTWVASTTTCLNTLGIDCDLVDVAGASGYTFTMSVLPDLCPSGPTMLNWGSLLNGVNMLGRSTMDFQSGDCHTGDFICDRTRDHCRKVFDLVSREIHEGRPCVIWGVYVPEFSVVYGVEGETYLVKSFRECMNMEQPPVKFDDLDAPGGPYMLAFPTPTGSEEHKTEKHSAMIDKLMLTDGVARLTSRTHFPTLKSGLKAYDNWVQALETETANVFGNAYNAQCWHEAKYFAKEFIAKLALKHEKVKDPLNEAVGHYSSVVDAMKTVSTLFPFPPGEQLKEESCRLEAVKALKGAQKDESLAVDAITRALDMDWL